MTIVSIENLAEFGTIKDKQPHDLPLNAWSDSKNVRIKDDAVKSAVGSLAINGSPSIAPYYLDHFTVADVGNLIYAGLDKIYSVEGGAHTNRTRQTAAVDVDYNAAAGGWNGGILGGVPILNNGVDLPQSYNSVTGKFQDLPNWDTTVTAKVMRPFREFLVALDVTKTSGSDRFPHMVKWSHPTDPGTTPASWDETDPSKDAGEYPLVDTGGSCVDLIPLRDFGIVYKTDSLYSMQFIGAPFIFKFNKLNFGSGLLSANCTGYVKNGHFVVSNEDIIWHNGVDYQQVGPKRINDWVFRNINQDYSHTSFVAVDMSEQKVHFCFPSEGATLPNLMLVWDWPSDTFMIQDCAGLSAMHYGLSSDAPGTSEPWTGDTDTWDSDGDTWGQRSDKNLGWEFLAAQASPSTILSYSRGNTANGVAQMCYVERTGIPLAGQDRDGKPILDLDSWKLYKAIWPKIKITPGASLSIRVGVQTLPGGPVTWSGPYSFDPSVDNKINCLLGGRFLCMRFESEADVAWELTGYDVEVELVGRF